jgi:transcription initiation factor IIE alpha subunit
MTSADEKIAKAIIDNGCPLTEAEIEVETGLRPSAIRNGLRSLREQRRLQKIRDGHTYLYGVKA